MDASPLFDPKYLPVVLATLIGFSAIAALLLVPVYRFLEREEEVAEQWTPEELAARRRERDEDGGDGAAGSSPPEAAVDREADGAA
jgi:hypothetical protein